jgi:DNA-binding PucR family transcriptional regulator
MDKDVAARLGVHPNTVRYRLRRIDRLTARQSSSFRGLVELLTEVAVARQEPRLP